MFSEIGEVWYLMHVSDAIGRYSRKLLKSFKTKSRTVVLWNLGHWWHNQSQCYESTFMLLGEVGLEPSWLSSAVSATKQKQQYENTTFKMCSLSIPDVQRWWTSGVKFVIWTWTAWNFSSFGGTRSLRKDTSSPILGTYSPSMLVSK